MGSLNDCVYWAENRADRLWLDEGCIMGYSWCDPKTCPDYRSIKH